MASASVAVEGGEDVTRTFLNFLNSYTSEDERAGENENGRGEGGASYKEYVEQLELMYERSGTTIYVNFQHLMEYDGVLAHEAVEANFYKYQPFLRRAVLEFVREHKPLMVRWDGGKEKDFWVAFVNLPRVHRLRELKAENIGQLTSFSGTVTRTSEVRPELLLGAFKCVECGTDVPDVEQQCRYTTPAICTNAQCGNRMKWELSQDGCKFVDWQRVRVQVRVCISQTCFPNPARHTVCRLSARNYAYTRPYKTDPFRVPLAGKRKRSPGGVAASEHGGYFKTRSRGGGARW